MQPEQKIFSILLLTALIAILISRPSGTAIVGTMEKDTHHIPRDRLGESKLPAWYVLGPTYLLGALPAWRRRDDYADASSVGIYDFSGDEELEFGQTG